MSLLKLRLNFSILAFLTIFFVINSISSTEPRARSRDYELFLGDVRGGIAENYLISKINRGKGFEHIGRRYKQGECPRNFKYMGGAVITGNHGLWTCVNNEVAETDFFTFYIGDVVDHHGFYFELTEDGLAEFGERGWDFCNEGYEVAVEKYKDGFWVCRGNF